MTRQLVAVVASTVLAAYCLFLGYYVVANWGGPIKRQFVATQPGTPQPVSAAQTAAPERGIAPQPVPILMFHYVRTVAQADDPLGYDLSVDPELFARQLDRLRAAGYATITPAQFLTGQVPDRSLILTFDDGYADFYETAYPELAKRQMTAVAFVISGKLDDPDHRYLTRTQVKALSDAGIEIGSHTVSHVNLATATAQRVRDELLVSRQVLEQVTGRRVNALAYPSGQVTAEVATIADYVGYSFAATTQSGIALPSSPRLLLPRIRVRGGESPDDLLAALTKAAAGQSAPAESSSDPLER